MMMRRSKRVGGELGGPKGYRMATTALFVFLWLFYVLMSSLEAYGYIQGMFIFALAIITESSTGYFFAFFDQ